MRASQFRALWNLFLSISRLIYHSHLLSSYAIPRSSSLFRVIFHSISASCPRRAQVQGSSYTDQRARLPRPEMWRSSLNRDDDSGDDLSDNREEMRTEPKMDVQRPTSKTPNHKSYILRVICLPPKFCKKKCIL